MPGRVLSTNFDSAISAPVLPAETAAPARPSFTASIARHMLVLRPWRSTWDGLASAPTLSGVCSIVERAASSGRPASSWRSTSPSPNSRKRSSGTRSRAMSAPAITTCGA